MIMYENSTTISPSANEHLEGPVDLTAPAAVVPGVVVMDVSFSMNGALPAAREALNDLIADMRRAPLVAEMAHMAIVTFAGSAATDLSFAQIADPAVHLPELSSRGGGTNYAGALEATRSELASGLPLLGTATDGGRRVVNRPTVYFVSDGQPNTGGDWRAALAALKEERWSPNVFSFGFGDADRGVMAELADDGCAYFAADGNTPQGVLQQIMRVILKSMVSVSQAVAGNASSVAAPDPSSDPNTAGLVKTDPISVGP